MKPCFRTLSFSFRSERQDVPDSYLALLASAFTRDVPTDVLFIKMTLPIWGLGLSTHGIE